MVWGQAGFPGGDGVKVFMLPRISEVRNRWETSIPGGALHYQYMLAKYIARQGWDAVDERKGADLVHGFCVVNEQILLDVLSIQAVWPEQFFKAGTYPDWWSIQNDVMRGHMKTARRIVVGSNFTADMCEQLSGVRATVVPQAIDPEEWEGVTEGDWRQRLGISKETPLVLWGKSCVDVLRDITPALQLAERQSDVIVVATALPREVPHAPPNFRAVGPLLYTRMQSLIAACDVLLTTTIEASGIQYLEALWMGKPLLAFRWGGVVEIIEANKAEQPIGVLVPPNDWQELSKGLETILNWQGRAAKTAHELVATQWTWPVVVGRQIAVYGEVMG